MKLPMRRCASILFSLCVLQAVSSAGGPVYSRYGIGDLLWFGGTRGLAMGGPGYALSGDGFLNLINPAGLSGIRFTRFDGSFSYTSYSSVSAGVTAPYWKAGLQNIALGIPIDTSRGIVMSIETAPYSSVSYATTRTVTQSGVVSTQSLFGVGGLSTISVGASVNILKNLSVGLKAAYLYGRTQQYTTIDFENSLFTDDAQDRSTYYKGYQITVGSIYAIGPTLFGLPLPGDLNVGLVITLPTKPSTEYIRSYRALDTALSVTGNATIPLRVGAGARLLMNQRYTAIADVAYQNWGSVDSESPATLRTALRMSAGFEIMPKPNETSFFDRLIYRVGAGYEQTYLQVSGTAIDNLFGTVGISFPIGPSGLLNTSFMVGRRGTTAGSLQQDTYLNVTVGITGGELWFMEFNED